MAVLSWGKPKVEISELGPGGTTTTWDTLPEIVINTAQLTTEAGTRTEALEEGGGVVDVRYEKSKYSFVCQLFVKKDDEKPIEDEDGVIIGNYAVRLTPEDPETEGFIMDRTSVSCVETWTSADGKRWAYTFSGLIPETGNILKPYLAP